jgi:hypothetical protein
VLDWSKFCLTTCAAEFTEVDGSRRESGIAGEHGAFCVTERTSNSTWVSRCGYEWINCGIDAWCDIRWGREYKGRVVKRVVPSEDSVCDDVQHLMNLLPVALRDRQSAPD